MFEGFNFSFKGFSKFGFWVFIFICIYLSIGIYIKQDKIKKKFYRNRSVEVSDSICLLCEFIVLYILKRYLYVKGYLI